jgi:glycosyltransferase involved in cell wall biosynthesis
MQNNNIIAVIPAYKEEIAIGSVVLKAKKYVDRVIVVDDGSPDKTAEVAELAGAEVIKLEENRGKAYALMKGFERAKELGCSIVVMLDGDGQHDPDEIPQIVYPVMRGEADLVIGSRFLENNGRIPKYRILGQKILTFATILGSEIKVTDSQSGFRAMNRKVLESFDFVSDGYSIESDMISYLSSKGFIIKEVPISAIYDVPNKHKKNPFAHGFGVLNDIIGLIGYKRPLLLFGISGFILTIIGLILGFWAFSTYYVTNKLPYGPSIGSALFLILGLQMATSGLILNSLVQIVKSRK